MRIENEVQALFIKHGWTLSLAESCTGGRVSSRLTAIPGASSYFLGSIVSYSNSVKEQLLGVPKEVLEEKGAVSCDVVLAMAEGVLKKMKSDFSIAISGIAGPKGGSFEKPVGTIWAAVARKGKETYAWTFHANGNRDQIIEESSTAVLTKLLELSLF